MRLSYILNALCMACLLALLSTSASAEGKTIVVATDYWPPFRMSATSGLTGIDVDLLQVVGEKMGVTFQFRRMPWARCLLSMEYGDVDMMTGLAWTKKRAAYIRYTSLPYYACAPAFYERKGRSGPPINSYEDLFDVEVAYTRNSAYFEPFDSDARLNKLAVNSEDQLIRMVADGRLDVFIGTDCQVEYDLAQLDLTQQIVQTPYKPELRIDLYFGVSKSSSFKYRMDELNDILRELVQDGTIRKIADRYLRNGSAPSQ